MNGTNQYVDGARPGNGWARALLVMLSLSGVSAPATAAVDEILEAIRQSEFRFARSTSEVPFLPVGWVQYQYYPPAEFSDDQGVLAPATATEHTASAGLVVPVHVDRRDMVLIGGDVAWDSIKVKAGPYRDQRIVRITPVAGWMHQLGTDHTVGAFVAPILSKEFEHDRPWSVNGFAGLIGMYWYSDSLQWVYGGIYESYFGDSFFYPYLGIQWNPTPKWSVAFLLPWPAVTYSPANRWLVQLGVTPGGSSWVANNDAYESTQAFGTWNTTLGIGYRLHGSWWLFAGGGMTGLRGLKQSTSGRERTLDAEPSPVYTIAIQFRP